MSSSLNPIAFAMRHPISAIVGVADLEVASDLAVRRRAIDVLASPMGGS